MVTSHHNLKNKITDLSLSSSVQKQNTTRSNKLLSFSACFKFQIQISNSPQNFSCALSIWADDCFYSIYFKANLISAVTDFVAQLQVLELPYKAIFTAGYNSTLYRQKEPMEKKVP
ncbi:hypothetical protein P8452_02778 [Trifolium repens]|nr:hypothetical protein P8452_02778 [Trifolium repens]